MGPEPVLRGSSVLVVVLGMCSSWLACGVFDESMRLPEDSLADASGSTPADAASSDGSAVDPDERCEMILGGGAGTAACGGAAGGLFTGAHEQEPNDDVPAALAPRRVVCGEVTEADVDKLTFTVAPGQCAELVVEGSATVQVEGAGQARTIPGSGTVNFFPAQGGSVLVTVTSPGGRHPYKMVLR